ncbi:MAG: hypothetical protein JNJ60_12520, partial [Rhodocyclaceae bacterium]|nr:hypothetical protein [Rhodocyclaceae bacterium]
FVIGGLATSGSIRLVSTGTNDVVINGDLVSNASGLGNGVAAIDVLAGRDIVLHSAATQIAAPTSGAISLAAGRNVDMMRDDACCNAFARSIAAIGNVSLSAAAGRIFRSTGDDYRDLGGATVTITAAQDIGAFGNIAASGNLSVDSASGFTAYGSVSAGGSATITQAGGNLVATSITASALSLTATNGNVVLAPGSHFTAATMNTAGSGQTLINGGNVVIDAAWTTAMPVVVTGATLDLSHATTLANLTLSNGSITGNGSLTTAGPFSLTNGTLGLAYTQQGSLVASGSNQFTGSAYVWQGGTISGSGSLGGSAPVSLAGSGDHVLAGPNLTVTNFAPTGGALDIQAGTLTLANGGTLAAGMTLNVAGGALVTQGPFNNAGALVVTAGAASLQGGGTHAGSFLTSGSGSIDFAGGTHQLGDGTLLDGTGFLHSGGSLVLTGSASGTTLGANSVIDLNAMAFGGSGKLVVLGSASGSNLTLGGAVLNSGNLTLDNVDIQGSFSNDGVVNIANSVTVHGAQVNQSAGDMVIPVGAQLVTDGGLFTWSGGAIHGTGGLGTGSLGFTNGGNFHFGGSGDRVIDGMNFAFTNLNLPDGSLTVQSGSLTLSGSTTIPTGTTLALAGGSLALAAGGTLNVAGAFNLSGGDFSGSGGINMAGGAMTIQPANTVNWTNSGLLVNTGVLDFASVTVSNAIDNQGVINAGSGVNFAQSISNTGTLNTTSGVAFAMPFVNAGSGSVNIPSGTVNFNGGYTQSGGTTTLGVSGVSQGNLLTGPAGFHLNGGTLAGNGSVNGDLVVGGSSALAPGFSPGALTINGNLTLAPNSVLDIQIGGS